MIDTPLWASFLIFLVCSVIPYLSFPLWIWGLIEAIKGPQDVWAVIYYIAAVVIFLPTIIALFSDLFNKISKKHRSENKINQIHTSNHEQTTTELDISNLNSKSTNKNNPKQKRTLIILSITTAIFFVSTVILSIGLISVNRDYNEITAKVKKLETNIEQQDAEISRLDRQLLNQQGTINSLNNDLYFYEAYAVCVDDNDSFYHRPGCEYFDDSSFYIYNTEAAKARGYSECPYCF